MYSALTDVFRKGKAGKHYQEFRSMGVLRIYSVYKLNICSQHTYTYVIYSVLNVIAAAVRLVTWSKDFDLARYQYIALPRKLARKNCEMKHI